MNEKNLNILKKRVKKIKPSPGETPSLSGIDIYGDTILKNKSVGGDHIIYIDFNKRYDINARVESIREKAKNEVDKIAKTHTITNEYLLLRELETKSKIESLLQNKSKAGIMVADVKGHEESDSFLVGMLHQSFLIGVLYELEIFGKITTNLFEIINTRFYRSSSFDDFLTMIYGEISEGGLFKFITAGHPIPIIFSIKQNKFIKRTRDSIISSPPIGIMPSKKDIDAKITKSQLGYKKEYTVNKINLTDPGDILIIYTDGLSEHIDKRKKKYFPDELEKVLKECNNLSSKKIYYKIKKSLFNFNKKFHDDITYVIIKKEK